MATGEVAAPVDVRAKRSRIAGIDVARGIALIGMAATHVVPTDNDDYSLTAVGWLFAGKASALFAVLAGVSLAIVTGGRNPFSGKDLRRSRVTIAVRAALVGLLGLLLAATDTYVAVILAYYAVFFLLTLPFLGLRARTLALLAVAWALLSPQLSYLLRTQLLPDPPRDQVDLEMLLTQPFTALHGLLFTGYYPAFTWLTYLLAGLAIGRIDLRSTRVAGWLLGTGAVLAAAAWGVSAYLLGLVGASATLRTSTGSIELVGGELNRYEWYGVTTAGVPQWLLLAGPHSGTTFDLLHTTGTAMAVLGACLLLARGIGVRLLRPLAAVGSMTLTLYTLHVLSLAGPIQWPAPGWYAAQVLLALVAAPLWLMRFRRGPLEELVHDVSTSAGLKAVPREAAALE